jgi:transcriptional regulator with XRE-family HTH domain
MASQLRRNPEVTRRVGINIARARLAKGWTQMQLARALDDWTDSVTVSRWECGRHRPVERTLNRLAEVLEVDVDWFYAVNEPEDEDEAA